MEYRKAGIGDIGSLADLRSDQIVQEGGSLCADIVDELKKQFENEISGDMITILAAFEDERMIGMAGYSLTGSRAYITNVYVRAEHRREGIASRLMDMLADDASACGCEIMCLHATEQGRRLYEKTGFTDRGGLMIKPLK